MRSLYHPSIHDITVQGILHALADPVRVQIYMQIAKADCPQICSTFLQVLDKQLPKSTLSQHFRILREAGLIRSERKGVEMHNVTRCAELKERFGPLVMNIIDAYHLQQQSAASSKT
ncbi:MAG: ArsR/SmtB family transcription factor [Alphaproteobacteria bacterium]